ncbi:NS1-like protein, partial [Dinothrombium tinctorium]
RVLPLNFEGLDHQEFESDKFYSIEESVDYVSRWCKFQSIDMGEFVASIIKVFDKLEAKKNTFALIGESNSGKSWILKPIYYWAKYYGEIQGGLTSYNFMYQDCVGKRAIFMEEPEIAEGLIENFKLVAGGQATYL